MHDNKGTDNIQLGGAIGAQNSNEICIQNQTEKSEKRKTQSTSSSVICA